VAKLERPSQTISVPATVAEFRKLRGASSLSVTTTACGRSGVSMSACSVTVAPTSRFLPRVEMRFKFQGLQVHDLNRFALLVGEKRSAPERQSDRGGPSDEPESFVKE